MEMTGMMVEKVGMSSEEESKGKEIFLGTHRNHLNVLFSSVSHTKLFCA